MYTIAIEWKNQCPKGHIVVRDGELISLEVDSKDGSSAGNSFSFNSDTVCRMTLNVETETSDVCIVSVINDEAPFSFLLKDVSSAYPMFIERYGVVVTTADDTRSYGDIETAIKSRNLQTKKQIIESEHEESFENASQYTRIMHCPTWLGVSRDARFFEFIDSYEVGLRIKPSYPWVRSTVEGERGYLPYQFNVQLGRGAGCVVDMHRRLEDGVLPIMHGSLVDDEISYDYTVFTSLEYTPLTQETLKGTDYLESASLSAGFMITPEQEGRLKELADAKSEDDEQTVFYGKVTAANNGYVPRYAWFRAPVPLEIAAQTYYTDGIASCEDDKYFCVAKYMGQPLPKDEIAVLLKPGETAVWEFALPHSQISKERAEKLLEQDFEQRRTECHKFWQTKLDASTSVKVPEQRIDEMIRAGLLHLDTSSFGKEPDGPVATNVGVYAPIGTESSPIIQFIDSMGWHDVAERALDFFFATQHDDGFVQNFGGYEVETQAFLWSAGEHYRYTRDNDWVRRVEPGLLKACNYLRAWRERNLKEELRGKGYGMLEGRVADPTNKYRYFMANSYYSLGLSRVAEMLEGIGSDQAEKLRAEAEALKNDVRTAVKDAIVNCPVVPLGDGTWCPTVPGWAEAGAPSFMALDRTPDYTHYTFVLYDTMLGPLYLPFGEVLDANEPITNAMIDYHTDMLFSRNVAFSQPYYCRHSWVHLKRGEVKAFLKTYYNGFSGLSDRESYDFWEHYFFASPHKTHEEGWFLLETRWMLYMEDGNTLNLLPGIPRKWLEDGKVIEIENAANYFGPISYRVKSELSKNQVKVKVVCNSDRKPESVKIRIPHPECLKAKSTSIGIYDPATETVTIESFTGTAELVIEF